MYSVSQLKRGLKTPSLFGRELNGLHHRRFNRRSYNTNGVDIFAEDWDNLLLLDACRHDMFERIVDLPGELTSRISRGSSTVEFLTGNCQGRNLYDTVYVTANPQLYRKRERLSGSFHDVIHVWNEDGWDEEFGTVLPETVSEYALDAAEIYPNKRLLVHYIQPHYPFLTGDLDVDKGHLETQGTDDANIWTQLMEGTLDIDTERIWEFYDENLRRVVPSLKTMFDELDGKTVVSSDHGNMVGERARPIPIQEWGHPRGIYTEQLVRVPWLVGPCENRREIISEVTDRGDETGATDSVDDRLKQLGYL